MNNGEKRSDFDVQFALSLSWLWWFRLLAQSLWLLQASSWPSQNQNSTLLQLNLIKNGLIKKKDLQKAEKTLKQRPFVLSGSTVLWIFMTPDIKSNEGIKAHRPADKLYPVFTGRHLNKWTGFPQIEWFLRERKSAALWLGSFDSTSPPSQEWMNVRQRHLQVKPGAQHGGGHASGSKVELGHG